MVKDLEEMAMDAEESAAIEDVEAAAEEDWWLFFYHDPKTVAVKIAKSEKYYDVIKEVFRERE